MYDFVVGLMREAIVAKGAIRGNDGSQEYIMFWLDSIRKVRFLPARPVVWRISRLLLHRISSENGIVYFRHFGALHLASTSPSPRQIVGSSLLSSLK